MSVADSPFDSVKAFATLCAKLDQPFAERGALLAQVNMDLVAFDRLRDRWAARLSAEEGGALRALFAEAYSAARCRDAAEAAAGGEAAAEPDAEHVPEPSPPPERAAATEEVSPMVELSNAALDVPTFMREASSPVPPPPALAASLAAPDAASPPVTPPVTSDTGVIDLAQLLRGTARALPFDPSARPGAAAVKAPAASAPPAAPQPLSTGTAAIDVSKILKTAVPFDDSTNKPSSSFTETEEFNLSDLLKRGAPVPFAKPKSEPETAELPRVATAPLAAVPPTDAAPAPTAPRGRWIRFNPQTGEPLAAPRWEALPVEEKK